MTDAFAQSTLPFLDMAANQVELGNKIAEGLKPMFADLGLALDSFVVENLSLPEELQKMLDTRIGMNMLGDMNKYTQYQVANSMPIAAANEGGTRRNRRGTGRGIHDGADHGECAEAGRGSASCRSSRALLPRLRFPAALDSRRPWRLATETKFCINCGKPMPRSAKFCPECGTAQS